MNLVGSIPLSQLHSFHKLKCFAKCIRVSARLLVHDTLVTQEAVHGPDK